MANKFSNFSEEKNAKSKVEQIRKEEPIKTKSIEKQMEQYSNLSQDELMQEFMKETQKGKKDGTINSDYLTNIKSTLMPYLNNDQKQNLNKLMDMINE